MKRYVLRLEVVDPDNLGYKTKSVSDYRVDNNWSVGEVLKLERHLKRLILEIGN